MNSTHEDRTPPPGGEAPPAPRDARLSDYDAFVDQVRRACADSGTQQALRRALAKPVHEVPTRTHAALLRNGLLPYDTTDAERWAHYTVAALIAARPRAERMAQAEGRDTADTAQGAPDTAQDKPAADDSARAASEDPQQPQPFRNGARPPSGVRPSWGTSLGASLAQAVARDGSDGLRAGGAESRLHLLVRQETDGLHRMLPGVLRLLGSAGAPADYGRLLYDIARWPYRREETATRWLEDYYRTLRRAEQARQQNKD